MNNKNKEYNINKPIYIFILIIFMLLLFQVNIAFAQEVLEVKEWNVDLKPEYDDPRLLVVHEIEMKESVKFPFEMKFLIPKDAEIGMACEIMENGGHSCKPFDINDVGEFSELSYQVSSRPTLFFEYYTNAIEGDPDKKFDYLFKPFQNIESFKINIQQPKVAKDFKVNPVPMESFSDGEGFKYSILNYANLNPDKELSFKVNYNKPGNDTSVAKQEGLGQSAQQQNSGSGITSQGDNNQLILLLFFIGGIIFFSFGAMTFFNNNKKYRKKYYKGKSKYRKKKKKKRNR